MAQAQPPAMGLRMGVGQGAGVEAQALVSRGASSVLVLRGAAEGGGGSQPRARIRAGFNLLDPVVSGVFLRRLGSWYHCPLPGPMGYAYPMVYLNLCGNSLGSPPWNSLVPSVLG